MEEAGIMKLKYEIRISKSETRNFEFRASDFGFYNELERWLSG